MDFPYGESPRDPIVYIFGVCWNEGGAGARAGYGLNWRADRATNERGTSWGPHKTTLAAELTAVKRALEIAVQQKMNRLLILHKSKQLEEELETWKMTAARYQPLMPNHELLGRIESLRLNVHVTIDEALPIAAADMKVAKDLAKQVVGMHPLAPSPLNNELWKDGVPIVHIFGTTKLHPRKAGYGVYWGPGDERNECGGVTQKQTSIRAQIAAVYAAMATALDHDIDALILRSRFKEMNALNRLPKLFPRESSDAAWEASRDLTNRIVELKAQFRQIRHEQLPELNSSVGEEEAERLAMLFRPLIRADVFVSSAEMPAMGVVRTPGKPGYCIARYGVFFAQGDRRNESGRIHGEPTKLVAEMMAVRRAIERAKESGIRFLTVRTMFKRSCYFLTTEMYHWKKKGWKADNFGVIEKQHAVAAKKVFEVMENIKIKAVVCGSCYGAREAAGLARTVNFAGQPTVFTSGAYFHSPVGEHESGYGVFWKVDDQKNTYGPVCGYQNINCAQLTAVLKALEKALENNIRRVVVYVECEFIYRLVASNLWSDKTVSEPQENQKYKILLDQIEEKVEQLENVEYEIRKNNRAAYLSQWVIRSNIKT